MNEQIILRDDSKALSVCNRIRLFEGEQNVDYFQILIPKMYNDIDLSQCDARMVYITPDGKENSILINENLQDELYEDCLVYLVLIDKTFTTSAGELQLYLSFTSVKNSSDIVLKTSTAVINMDKHPSGTNTSIEEKKDIIDEILLKSKEALDKANSVDEKLNTDYYPKTDVDEKLKDKVDNDLFDATLIKPIESGTEMVFNDSSNMNIQELHLYGKSEQTATTGAQLFDVNDKLNWNSVFSVDDEDWISAIIPANAGTTDTYYAFNTKKSDLLKPSTTYLAVMELGMTLGSNINIVGVSPNAGAGNISQFQGYTPFTKQSVIPCKTINSFENSNVMCKGYIQAKPGFAGGSVKFRFSLIEDTSVTIDNFKYEPYSGGEPSPSPNYKQNIESTDNPTIKLAGKNLFDKFCDNKHVERFGITFDWNTNDSSIRIKGTSMGNAQYVLISLDESEKKFNNSTIGSNYTFKMFGLPKSCYLNVSYGQKAYGEDLSIMPNISKYVGRRWVAICVPKGVTVDATVYPMLVLGDTINEYEPYKPIQSVAFNYSLNGIDDCKDELVVKADGTGQLIQRIKLYDCSQISRNLGVDPNNKYYYLASIDKNTTHASKVVSSHFTSKTFNEKWGNVFKVNGSFYFGKQEAPESITDENTMKQWLIGNKVKILFQLEEPVVTNLTAEEVQKVLAINTYKPVTTIWNDQNADMEITYVADAKNYIDNKLAEIQALTLEGGN